MTSPSLREFESLYRSSFRRFVRVASAITRDEDAAAEAVQEAFARSIRGRSGFRGDGPLDAWLWRAVVNEAKRLSARPTTLPPEVAVEATANGAAHSDAAVRALIGSLPERQRHAVFLRYYADLDYRTIADVLEIEVGSVSATLHAAHATLRGAIEGVRS